MKDHVEYLKYVLRHKWFVFLACRRLHVRLWQSIIHDWTKFLPVEWFPYVRNFYNPDGSKRTGEEGADFILAWRHHQKTNPHHWQYWVLINDTDGINALSMPVRYVLEMVADWDGAGRAITGKSDPAAWYERHGGKMILHPATRNLVENILKHFYGWQPAWEKQRRQFSKEGPDSFNVVNVFVHKCDEVAE